MRAIIPIIIVLVTIIFISNYIQFSPTGLFVEEGGNFRITSGTISECQDITSSGTWELSGNLEGNQSSGVCLNISASDVYLDCKGYRITGNETGSAIGIFVYESNATIINCTIQNYTLSGIYVNNTEGINIEYNTLENNSATGVAIFNSTEVTLDYNNIMHNKGNCTVFVRYSSDLEDDYSDGPFGIFVMYSNNTKIEHNYLEANGYSSMISNTTYGLYCFGANIYQIYSNYSYIYNNTAIGPAYRGIYSGGNYNSSSNNRIISNYINDTDHTSIEIYGNDANISNNIMMNGKSLVFSRGNNGIVFNNTFYNCLEGLDTLYRDNGIVSYNKIYGPSTYMTGYSMWSGNNNTFKNNVFEKTLWMYVANLTNSIIESNYINDIRGSGPFNGAGLHIRYCENLTIKDNEIYNANMTGILISNLKDTGGYYTNRIYNITIENTTIANVSYGPGIKTDGVVGPVIIKNSKINNTTIGILINETNNSEILSNEIYNSSSHGIYINSRINNTVNNNKIISSYGEGILFNSSKNNIISYNTIYDFVTSYEDHFGIWLYKTNNSEVKGNTIYNRKDGIALTNSHENNITENTLYDNFHFNIELYGNCSGNNILNNTLYTFARAIDSALGIANNCINNKVINNSIFGNYNNVNYGALYISNSTNTTFEQNTIENTKIDFAYSEKPSTLLFIRIPTQIPAAPSGYSSLNKTINITGTSLDWLDLKMRYSDQDITTYGISDEGTLRIMKWNETAWEDITEYAVPAQNYIKSNITSFSMLGLFGRPIEAAPPAGGTTGVSGGGVTPSYECIKSTDCPEDKLCIDHKCIVIACECGYIKNRQCIPYECCIDSACRVDEKCVNHVCVAKKVNQSSALEIIEEANRAIQSALNEGKDISAAEDLLKSAQNAFKAGDYESAYELARQAIDSAKSAKLISEQIKSPKISSGLIYISVVFAIFCASVVFYYRHAQKMQFPKIVMPKFVEAKPAKIEKKEEKKIREQERTCAICGKRFRIGYICDSCKKEVCYACARRHDHYIYCIKCIDKGKAKGI